MAFRSAGAREGGLMIALAKRFCSAELSWMAFLRAIVCLAASQADAITKSPRVSPCNSAASFSSPPPVSPALRQAMKQRERLLDLS